LSEFFVNQKKGMIVKKSMFLGWLATLLLSCFMFASTANAQEWVSTGGDHRVSGWATTSSASTSSGGFSYNPERAIWGGSVSNGSGLSASFSATPWASGTVSTGARGGFADSYFEMNHGGSAYADQFGASANNYKRAYGSATSSGDGAVTIRFGIEINSNASRGGGKG
jgi:hypothetical protein